MHKLLYGEQRHMENILYSFEMPELSTQMCEKLIKLHVNNCLPVFCSLEGLHLKFSNYILDSVFFFFFLILIETPWINGLLAP